MLTGRQAVDVAWNEIGYAGVYSTVVRTLHKSVELNRTMGIQSTQTENTIAMARTFIRCVGRHLLSNTRGPRSGYQAEARVSLTC